MKQIFANKHVDELTDGELDLVCAMLHSDAIRVVKYYPEGFEDGPRLYVRPLEQPTFTSPIQSSVMKDNNQLLDVINVNNIYSMKLNRTTGRWKVRSEHVKTYDTRLEKAVVINVIIQHLCTLSEDISVMVNDHNEYKFGVVQ